MKQYFLAGLMASGVLCAASSFAQAQYYNSSGAKDGQNLLNDTRRIEQQGNMPLQQRSQNQESSAEISRMEPAAGKSSHKSPFADFTGIYGGLGGGYSFTDDAEGWSGGPFLGYGFEHKFRWLGAYAGIEIGYDWSGADSDSGGTSYEKNGAFLATFRPGVSIMGDGLGYGIIGYTRAEFESAGAEEDLDGLVLGLGGQFNTNTPFKPRLEYTYTNYEDGSIGGSSFAATENTVKLGAVFQF